MIFVTNGENVALFTDANISISLFLFSVARQATGHCCEATREQYLMKGQSEIAYLPKFANMILIVMMIVITEILYVILIFDCFENQ